MIKNADAKTNKPENVIYPQPRPAIVKNSGGTKSEKILASLGEKSFLNLWSFPSPYIDKQSNNKGDGKELCDLLVVCGDHVLIFSDKTIAWPDGPDVMLSWRRWYKRAIASSADQIFGAERWINRFPDRIFLDNKCTQKLPIEIPPPERRKVHRIVVALGAVNACEAHFVEGIGSLMILPAIHGDQHWKPDTVVPFTIGDVNPSGGLIHVLDDATLDIVLSELDTISDFTAYLTKKEELFRSGKLTFASGEEDLVAYYMTHMNKQDEHDFTKPDGSSLSQNDFIGLASGFHTKLIENPQYLAKKSADKNSYVWDRLIEAFTTHMLAGTTIVPQGDNSDISVQEQGVRHKAAVPRFQRRNLGDGILEALRLGSTASRFTRAFLPGPTEKDQDTGFFFMTLALPTFELDGGYEQYRDFRRNLLHVYALAFLQKHPKLKQIVGIATEPPNQTHSSGSSEDLIFAPQPTWTTESTKELVETMKTLNIVQSGNYTEYAIEGNEFPDISQQYSKPQKEKLNRHDRRKKAVQDRHSA